MGTGVGSSQLRSRTVTLTVRVWLAMPKRSRYFLVTLILAVYVPAASWTGLE